MNVRLTVQVPYISMDCTVHCVSIGAQFISGTVANRFSTLRSLGRLHKTEAVEEFSCVFDNFFNIWNTQCLEEADRKRNTGKFSSILPRF